MPEALALSCCEGRSVARFPEALFSITALLVVSAATEGHCQVHDVHRSYRMWHHKPVPPLHGQLAESSINKRNFRHYLCSHLVQLRQAG